MEIRDATPADVEAIERLAPGDLDGTRLVLDRRVIVAETDDEIVGMLSYDAWEGAVHVSTLVGDDAVLEALLEEPRRFAENEGLPIEIVVPESDERLIDSLTEAGFEGAGEGPTFAGEPSRRFRDGG